MIHPFIRKIVASIREELGSPVRFEQLLDSYPAISVDLSEPERPSINYHDAVPWHQLCPQTWVTGVGRGYVKGWRYVKDARAYQSYVTEVNGYDRLGQRLVVEDWPCDIRNVHGLCASKSDLSAFRSMSEMAAANCRNLVGNGSLEDLQRNLSHENVGALHSRSSDFEINLWSAHIYLANSGGSHHFAAAHFIAQQIDEPVLLRRKAVFNHVDPEAVHDLLKEYVLYALPGDVGFTNKLHEAMEGFRAGYLMHPLPGRLNESNAILLPRADARSMQVAQILHDAGATSLSEKLSKVARESVRHAPMIRRGASPDGESQSHQRPIERLAA